MRTKRSVAAFLAAAVATATLGIASPNAAFADSGTTNEIVAALNTVDARNDSLVVEPVLSVADADSAGQTSAVDIPTDPTKGVTLKGPDGQSVTVKLPSVHKGDRGRKAASGVVVFGSKADSVNAAVPTEAGVQMWTHIRNKNAPQDYRYCVDDVTFTVLPSGGAIGVNRANQPVTFVPPPTATEVKTGKSIPTNYKAEGNCLVQHVAHKAKGTSYPVVADPIWIPAWVLLACGVGWSLGIIGYWITGGNDARQAFGSGAVGCIGWLLGKKI